MEAIRILVSTDIDKVKGIICDAMKLNDFNLVSENGDYLAFVKNTIEDRLTKLETDLNEHIQQVHP